MHHKMLGHVQLPAALSSCQLPWQAMIATECTDMQKWQVRASSDRAPAATELGPPTERFRLVLQSGMRCDQGLRCVGG